MTQGQTIWEAFSRAKEAKECHVEALADLGKRAPADLKTITLDTTDLAEALIPKVIAEPDNRDAKGA